MKKIIVNKYTSSKFSKKEDVVLRETKYTLFLNGEKEFVFTCIDDNLKEMVLGYLVSECHIQKLGNIHKLEIAKGKIFVDIKEVNGIAEKRRNVNISPKIIFPIFKNFIESSRLHKATGAVHSMAIAEESNIIVQIDDISRHTALDKLFGYCLLNGVDLSDKTLLSTCRITESIAKKASATSIPIILSKAAVTEQAIEICNEQQILLVGFVKDNSFNVYTCFERIN